MKPAEWLDNTGFFYSLPTPTTYGIVHLHVYGSANACDDDQLIQQYAPQRKLSGVCMRLYAQNETEKKEKENP